MKYLVILVLIVLIVAPVVTVAQDDDGGVCAPDQIDFLTQVFIEQFNVTSAANSPLFSATDRLNLMWEYVAFVVTCREAQPCEDLSATYAEAIAAAETSDELAILSANFAVDIALCQPTHPLTPIFEELGFTCSVLFSDEAYIEMTCEGENSQDTAQTLYDAALEAQDTLGLFSVTLNDTDSETRYIHTEEEWLVEPHFGP